MLTVQSKRNAELKTATLKEFSGGLNVLDDDLNLATKFSKKLNNCFYSADQTIRVRQGTTKFVGLSAFVSDPFAGVINLEYFGAALIAVMSNGEICKVLGDGTVTRIWSTAIAALLPGTPAGWGTTEFASFEQFNNQLIICNGKDKPLLVAANLTVSYLQDLATNSNVNTPIAKYVTSCNGYLIMAGDPVKPNRVHISARYTSGTFYGDPAPNDATYVDVGTSLRNASIIKGIRAFRDKLIVAYVEGTVIGTLGIYNAAGTVHQPTFQDTVELYGSVAHRTLLSYGDDMLMLDSTGVPSLKRTVFTGTIRPERVSDVIDPETSKLINGLTGLSQENRCFSVYNQPEGIFMFFIPNNNDIKQTTETTAYCFLYRPTLNASAWYKCSGWNFTCGARSLEGHMFFGDAKGNIWRMGSGDSPLYSDYLNDDSINSGEGVPISFDWELPWNNLNKRMSNKTSKYLQIDSRGSAKFNVSMYCDRYVEDKDANDAPALTMDMAGGDVIGFGGVSHPFGGGRRTSSELLYAWPAKFKLMKLRFRGETTKELAFVGINILYQEGSYLR